VASGTVAAAERQRFWRRSILPGVTCSQTADTYSSCRRLRPAVLLVALPPPDDEM
jgi:hypothetical protein